MAGTIGTAAGLLPLLDINRTDVYVRLGALDQARAHLADGRATLTSLPDDGYGAMINGGLDRIVGAIENVHHPSNRRSRTRRLRGRTARSGDGRVVATTCGESSCLLCPSGDSHRGGLDE